MAEYILLFILFLMIPFVLTKSPFAKAEHNHNIISSNRPIHQLKLDEYVVYMIITGRMRYFPGRRFITVYIYPPTSLTTQLFIVKFLGYLPSHVKKEMESRIQNLHIVKDDMTMMQKVQQTPFSIGYTSEHLLVNDGKIVHIIDKLPHTIYFSDLTIE